MRLGSQAGGPVIARGRAASDGLAGLAPHRGDLLRADPELDVSRLDLQAAVPGVNGQNLAGQTQGRQKDLLAGQEPGRLRRGRGGLGRQVCQQLGLAPGKLLAQLAPGLNAPVQPPDDRFKLGLGLLDAGQGCGFGFVDQPGALGFQLRQARLQLMLVLRQLRLPPFELIRLAGQVLLGRFHRGQEPVGPEFVLVEVALGHGQNLRVEPHFPGEFQGVGGPHHPVGQAIGGPPGLLVEHHRHILEAIGFLGKTLKDGQVGGGGPVSAPLIEGLEQGQGQGAPLGGVGGRTQLVQEDEGPLREVGEHLRARFRWAEKVLRLWGRSWGSPMSAKTAAKGQNSLPSATGMGMPLWTMRVKQAQGLQGHGLAAGVGPGDDEPAVFGVSVRSMGTTSGAALRLPPVLHQEGMAGLAEIQAAACSARWAPGP